MTTEREALLAEARNLACNYQACAVAGYASIPADMITRLADMLEADAQEIARSQAECDTIAEINHGQWLALENIRLLAARHRKEDWAQHMLRFCESAGSSATPLRAQQVAEREVPVETAITRLVESLCRSKGWMHAYAEARVRDAVDAPVTTQRI